jgi:transposase
MSNVTCSANRLKILWFDRNGYVLLYKRLHRAYFAIPSGPSGSVRIEASALGMLLAGVDRERRRRSPSPRTSARVIDLPSRRVKTLQ